MMIVGCDIAAFSGKHNYRINCYGTKDDPSDLIIPYRFAGAGIQSANLAHRIACNDKRIGKHSCIAEYMITEPRRPAYAAGESVKSVYHAVLTAKVNCCRIHRRLSGDSANGSE